MRKQKVTKVVVHGIERWLVHCPKELREMHGQSRYYFARKETAEAKLAQFQRDHDRIAARFHGLSEKDQGRILWLLEKFGGNLDLMESVYMGYFNKIKATKVAIPLKSTIETFIKAKEAANLRPRSIKALTSVLGKLCICLGDNADVTKVTDDQIEKWLSGNAWEPATRKGYLTDVRTFFSWCLGKGFIDKNPAMSIQKPKIDEKRADIHTPEVAALMMNTAMKHDKGLVGYLALCYFGFVRPSEALIFTKNQIKDTVLDLEAGKTKTRATRYVEINPTLKAWLDVKGLKFPVTNFKRRFDALRDLEELKDVKWGHDVLRHSCSSYGLIKFGGQKASNWAGHSEAVLFKHYRERVTADDAEKFWSIRP